MDLRSFAGIKPLLIAAEVQTGLCQGHTLYRQQLAINLEQELHVLLHRSAERINFVGARPIGDCGFFRRQAQLAKFHLRRGFGDRYCLRRRGFNRCAVQFVAGRKTPGASGNHPHSQAEGFRLRNVADLAILGRERALPLIHQARIGVAGAALIGGIECPLCDLLHILVS